MHCDESKLSVSCGSRGLHVFSMALAAHLAAQFTTTVLSAQEETDEDIALRLCRKMLLSPHHNASLFKSFKSMLLAPSLQLRAWVHSPALASTTSYFECHTSALNSTCRDSEGRRFRRPARAHIKAMAASRG